MALTVVRLEEIIAGRTEEEKLLELSKAIENIHQFSRSYLAIMTSTAHRVEQVLGYQKQQEQAIVKERRPAQRKAAPIQPAELSAKNDHIVRHIEIALMCPKDYKMNEEKNQLVYQHYFDAPRNKGTGRIRLIISGLAVQAHESINIALNSLGDACRDTFVALFGLYVERHGTSDMRKNFKISIDGILDTCGKQRSNGAFTPEARAEVIKHIKTLSQIGISFSMPTTKPVKQGRKVIWEDTEIKVKGPIIIYGGTIGEYSRITGKEYWEFHDVTFGQWAEFIDGNVQTKLLPQQVLTYSPSTEPHHKRLGHYITTLFRNNAQRPKGIMPHGITMGALFEGALIEPTRDRGRFKDAIDKALKHLKQDGVIGDYWYMAEKNSPEAYEIVNNRIGRWFDIYLGLFINFSPPKATIEHYRNIAKKEDLAENENT